ncbi:MAG: IS66 family insertion sequence element accessory protein TnpA [Burkholderiales bacterium]
MSRESAAASSARRESEWRDRIVRHAASGLSVKAFCERESVSLWSYYQWRSRFRSQGSKVVTAAATPRSRAPFIELSALRADGEAREADPKLRDGARFEIKLELGGGVVLHLGRF